MRRLVVIILLLDWFYAVHESVCLWQKYANIVSGTVGGSHMVINSVIVVLLYWYSGALGLPDGKEEATILFLGLENTGKTTLLHMLKDESVLMAKMIILTSMIGLLILRRVFQHLPPDMAPYTATYFAVFVWSIGEIYWWIEKIIDKYEPTDFERDLFQHQPTQYTSGEFCTGKIKFKAFVLGGHQILRRVLNDYYFKPDAVVFLVDACDREHFSESRRELKALLADESYANVPFLILGNKIDVANSASADELRLEMGLTRLTTGKGEVKLDPGVRPLEIFMCSIVTKMGYREGFSYERTSK